MQMVSLLPLLVLAAGIAVADVTHTMGDVPVRVNPETQRLIDEAGREVYFHGVNVVVKGNPWIPETRHWDYHSSFAEKDMAALEDLGVNGIRLGTMWPGAEPTQGAYNWTYIEALKNLTLRAADHGIYSLLDMHQDVFSQKFCGEGVPLWAAIPNVTNFPAPLGATYTTDPDGVPVGGVSGSQCLSKDWSEYYPSEACSTAFQNLYSNYAGIRDAWTAFWRTIAGAFVDTGAAVMGYELMNEPWAGDIYENIELMIPGVADKLNLQPAWDAAAAQIRTVDTVHSIFFEGVTWDWFNVGFDHVPGGSAWQNLSVLAWHFYVPPDFNLEIQFDASVLDMERLGCGGVLTEFSLKRCPGCGQNDPKVVMDACDLYHQSWLAWEYKPFQGNRTGWSNSIWFPNGTERTDYTRILARTYARVVAGITDYSYFNTSTKRYDLRFRTSSAVTNGLTKIYLSERLHYPMGYHIEAIADDPTVEVTVSHPRTNHLFVNFSVATTPSNTNISVLILPKA